MSDIVTRAMAWECGLANEEAQMVRELCDEILRLREAEQWRPFDPETMPKSGQCLVTDEDAADGSGMYGDIDLICLPVNSDGRTLSQITGNYARAGVWKYWRPAPATPLQPSPEVKQ